MRKLSCLHCLYSDLCGRKCVCKYFAPLDDEGESALIDLLVEEERIEYREAWFDYVSEEIE